MMGEEIKKSGTEPVKTEAEKLQKAGKISDTGRKKHNTVLKKAALYMAGTAFFFWFQKYLPNLFFMYKDKISLAVRCLYAASLADTAICNFEKFRILHEITTSADNNEITKREDGNSISDILFCISFGACYVLAYIPLTTMGAVIPLYGGINRLGITLCCMLAMFLFNRNKALDSKTLIFQMIIYVSAIGYMGRYGEIWIFATAVFVAAADGRKFMSIAKISLWCNILLIFLVFHLSATGVIEFIVRSGKKSFGFVGANETSMEILFFEIMYFFLRYCEKKRKRDSIYEGRMKYPIEILRTILDVLILMIGIWIIMGYTKGRASLVCIMALSLVLIADKFFEIFPIEKWNRGLQNLLDKIILVLLVPIHFYIGIFSFVVTHFYDSENPYKWISAIGKVFDTATLTSRLSLGKLALQEYVPTLFGNEIEETFVGRYFWIDNYYIKAYLKYGILLFICFLLIFTAVHYICWKKREYFVVFLMVIIAGLGFLEAPMGSLMYNVFPLMLFTRDRGILSCTDTKKVDTIKK